MKKIFLILAAAVMLSFTGCKQSETQKLQNEKAAETYAITIGDTGIPLAEFNIYLYETQKSFEELGGSDIWETDFDGRTAENVAIDNTLNSIQLVKFAVSEAEKRGIELDTDQIADAATEAKAMYNELSEDIREKIGADEELYYNVFEENILYNEVYYEIVKDYKASEEAFEEYYSENYDTVLAAYKSNVDSTEPINQDAVKDYGLEYYTDIMRQNYFSNEYNKWLSETSISKNDKVWNSIELIG